jgi:hypothetical protein
MVLSCLVGYGWLRAHGRGRADAPSMNSYSGWDFMMQKWSLCRSSGMKRLGLVEKLSSSLRVPEIDADLQVALEERTLLTNSLFGQETIERCVPSSCLRTNCRIAVTESSGSMNLIQRHDGEVADRRLGWGCGNKEQGDQRSYRDPLNQPRFDTVESIFPALPILQRNQVERGLSSRPRFGHVEFPPGSKTTSAVFWRLRTRSNFSTLSRLGKQAFSLYERASNPPAIIVDLRTSAYTSLITRLDPKLTPSLSSLGDSRVPNVYLYDFRHATYSCCTGSEEKEVQSNLQSKSSGVYRVSRKRQVKPWMRWQRPGVVCGAYGATRTLRS